MTDTVNVPRDVIRRTVVMAKAIMKAEPLYGCVGYHGDEQINGHVEEAADLACLVLDEMAEPVPAPNALAAAQKVEQEPETLRDRFAMAALTGLLANSESASAGFEPMPSYVARGGNAKWLADTCYTIADAMMEARK